MKSFFMGCTALLVAGMQLGACSSAAQQENSQPEREYVIVVHGGAGAMKGLENDAEKAAQYYAALDSALTIGDAILARGGEGPEAVMAVINFKGFSMKGAVTSLSRGNSSCIVSRSTSP